MARRRVFTIDEDLASAIAEDDDFFFGALPTITSPSDSSGDESEGSCDEERGEGAHNRVDVDAGYDDGSSEDVSDIEHHFLDESTDVAEAARRFSEDSSDGQGPVVDGASLGRVKSCGCRADCLSHFDEGAIESQRMNFREMEKREKEALLLGIMHASRATFDMTTKGKKRVRATLRYVVDGRPVCKSAFLYTMDVGTKQFKNLLKHLEENGPVPREHGNRTRRPHNALTFPVVKACVQFIKNHADEFGIPHPAPLHGRATDPPVFLPASHNFKTVHVKYVASCADIRPVGYSSFRGIWHQCLPNIKFMTPRTDVCDNCERLRQAVVSARTEEEKTEACRCFSEHIKAAQVEREYYKQCSVAANGELVAKQAHYHPPYMACSQDLFDVHYTFDFAQMVQLPHMSRQVGPIYFKTPRKVQLFGVCSDGLPRQINYLIDEAQCMGPNGTKSHGSNAVVSLLHHFFANYGHGEKKCFMHADNCSGQNKNKTLLSYLAWRVICGLHESMSLSFMIVGHTRCLVDGHFGLLKRRYRQHDIYTLPQLVTVAEDSAKTNFAHLVDGDGMWREWDVFLQQLFRPVKGVRSFQHFLFNSETPGVVLVKATRDGKEKQLSLLKPNVSLAQVRSAALPATLSAGGITAERQKYLFTDIRPHVPACFQDDLCPLPVPVACEPQQQAFADAPHRKDD